MSSSDDFMNGWTQGWMAATQALVQALQEAGRDGGGGSGARSHAEFLKSAGNKPSLPGQAGAVQGSAPGSGASEPVRRRRGRPPKNRDAQPVTDRK